MSTGSYQQSAISHQRGRNGTFQVSAISRKPKKLRADSRKPRASRAFTLVEILTVLAVIGVLMGLLLPALNSARENGRRVHCMNNLRQIGLAMMAYAGDNENHMPTALHNNAKNGPAWYNALIDGGYTTPKVFRCLDDRDPRLSGGIAKTPRSYAINVGDQNPDTDPTQWKTDVWIAGSRLTCPYLTNTAVVIVGEYYTEPYHTPAILPTIEDTTWAYIKNPYSVNHPYSLHKEGQPLWGNYLFLDGHVEWVERLSENASDLTAKQLSNEMFPQLPTGVAIPPCP